MKNTLLLLLSFACFTGVFAQGELVFTQEHNIISDINLETDFDIVGYNFVVNTTSITRELRWTINIVEMTPGWQVALCDRNQCYLPSTTTHTFNAETDTLNPMQLHAYPQGIEGLATVEIIVEDVNDASLSVTQTYYFSTGATKVDKLLQQRVKVYPNPSLGHFALKGTNNKVGFLDVINLTGQTLTSFEFDESQEYDISTLPKGTYLIRLMDENRHPLLVKKLNKL